MTRGPQVATTACGATESVARPVSPSQRPYNCSAQAAEEKIHALLTRFESAFALPFVSLYPY